MYRQYKATQQGAFAQAPQHQQPHFNIPAHRPVTRAAAANLQPQHMHAQDTSSDSLDAFVVETCLVPVSLNQIPDVMPQASSAVLGVVVNDVYMLMHGGQAGD